MTRAVDVDTAAEIVRAHVDDEGTGEQIERALRRSSEEMGGFTGAEVHDMRSEYEDLMVRLVAAASDGGDGE